MVAFHCVTCVGCTVYSRASCATVLSPTRASNPTLALKASLCRLRFAFIGLLSLISSRPRKVYLDHWSNFWGPPLRGGQLRGGVGGIRERSVCRRRIHECGWGDSQ